MSELMYERKIVTAILSKEIMINRRCQSSIYSGGRPNAI
ncbi:hypothetical Protein YC6258_02216 [Gynuella sunshinyii YC6258]|uniref:Uncharacterized protein n=1 Tax=Gynuella sunshinyii YC6258 TaxID=1445510 RepID=A0A0C5VV46_9GAMM|nr:hypothetical Protein YC6258_02216 [Gynuella sunshinyii YC6258]